MHNEFENLLLALVKPIVANPDDVSISSSVDLDETIVLNVLVHKDDLGRVIGKGGRIANAIRTISYACASKADKKVKVEFDTYEK
ncbi:MAG: KH domain-containing protein [Gammaproteobacteria bacterium]|nr:KH domain-containing protein [Gammaproteobacteria bacterium]